jgi:hypothetical protein
MRDLLDAPVADDFILDTEESSSSFSGDALDAAEERLVIGAGLGCLDPLSSRLSLSSSSLDSVLL